ncbi:bifunctional diaminohydroxyphosphoribosylaminopyrimidine deaminase/5-amino-6-(5-phosphoribosylamino)uracil reductase RibD [Magnetovibrio sp. PR-2]|uniref:bifunctional diaminohydroxyphosphoribosylaminopyrimidine deaminase/5-amino-6-(5-phosphoribosylamino)uracil reductase RibD n=1 Tax=Magnetovibrio sp. PR-2 TaxID=3120356 RepID=UPI002FCE4F42
MSANKPRDLDFMRAALGLARRGLGNTAPNPSVGCILVNDGVVVGHGWTQPGGRPHAEAMALAQAGNAAQGATAYVTLEPCAHQGQTPPCAVSLVDAGVQRVVIASSDPDLRVAGKGVRILKDAGIEVVEGVMADEGWRGNLGFFKRIIENRPQFTLKLATSADNRIPPKGAQGEDKWITSPLARARGHLLRANHDGVLFGIGTVLDDDPTYTCRLPGLTDQSPVRILLDSLLSLPQNSQLLRSISAAPLWIFCGSAASNDRIAELQNQGVTVIQSPLERPELTWVAQQLAARELNRVLVEAGPTLVNAVLNADLVDEIQWFKAKKELGAAGDVLFHDFDLEKLAPGPKAVLNAGPDLLNIYHLGT